jgi:hypothetical protein
MVSQIIKYVDAASVITTTTTANDSVRVAERAQIISPHDELLSIIEQAYDHIKTIAEHREKDMPIVNSPVLHKQYLNTKVHHFHPHANAHNAETNTTPAITLPPHTSSKHHVTRARATEYDSGDIADGSSGSDSDHLSVVPANANKRSSRKDHNKNYQTPTTTKTAATETAENTTTRAAVAATKHKPTVQNKSQSVNYKV